MSATSGSATPIAVSDLSEPEPDLYVTVPRSTYRAAHPTTATLVIEVSHTSRRRDLGIKARIYARRWHPRLLGHRCGEQPDRGAPRSGRCAVHLDRRARERNRAATAPPRPRGRRRRAAVLSGAAASSRPPASRACGQIAPRRPRRRLTIPVGHGELRNRETGVVGLPQVPAPRRVPPDARARTATAG